MLRGIGRDAVANTPIRFVATVKGTPRRYPPTLENQLLRIGQEAVTNAIRHAGASRITLELEFERGRGRAPRPGRRPGFEFAAIETRDHYGLTTMRERAESLRGEFRISTGSGRGTVVETVVPTARASQDAGVES